MISAFFKIEIIVALISSMVIFEKRFKMSAFLLASLLFTSLL